MLSISSRQLMVRPPQLSLQGPLSGKLLAGSGCKRELLPHSRSERAGTFYDVVVVKTKPAGNLRVLRSQSTMQ